MPFNTYACKRLKYTCTKRKCYSHTEQRVLITLYPAVDKPELALNPQPMCSFTNKPFWRPPTPSPAWNPSGPMRAPTPPGQAGNEAPARNAAVLSPLAIAEHAEPLSPPRVAGTAPGAPPCPPERPTSGGAPARRPGGSRTKRPVPLTLAGADEEISVGGDAAEGQVHHGPRVAGAGERGLPHGHGGGGGGAWAGHESGGPAGAAAASGGSDGQEALPSRRTRVRAGARPRRCRPAGGTGGAALPRPRPRGVKGVLGVRFRLSSRSLREYGAPGRAAQPLVPIPEGIRGSMLSCSAPRPDP